MQSENKQLEASKLLIAKMRDKEKLCKIKNKITYTDFLDMYQKSILLKEIKNDYIIFGGYDGAEREILLFYPDKIEKDIAKKYFYNLLKVISITLPNDLIGEYEHRVYLSGIMKLGLEREKFGDIIVYKEGADIITFEDNIQYLINGLMSLKRFRKCNFEIKDISEIVSKEDEYEEFSIILPSMRIDNFVSEIARVSRNRANEIIESQRVFINSELVLKSSKLVNISDIITIRGKGKFIVGEVLRKTEKRKKCFKYKKEKIKHAQ